MVTLPPEFAATKFPGYFWNVKTQSLFSIKVDGILKEMKRTEPSYWNKLERPAYRISVNGQRKWLHLTYLEKLRMADSVFPVRF